MITIGADPELFLTSTQTGRIVSAIGKIGGTKEEPKQVTDNVAVQEDNILAEFNIVPVDNVDDWIIRIREGVRSIDSIALKSRCRAAIFSSAIISGNSLRNPKAREFGCVPDYSAWTLEVNPSPNPDTSLRTAGGHIHVGGIDKQNLIAYVRAMDLFLGVPSVISDLDSRRRQLYGKAGSFRDKEYGLEYRTLSNFWLKNEGLMAWAYESTHRAIEWANANQPIDENGSLGKDIQTAINTSDRKMAQEIMNQFNISAPYSKWKPTTFRAVIETV